jgi:hypothetical protein
MLAIQDSDSGALEPFPASRVRWMAHGYVCGSPDLIFVLHCAILVMPFPLLFAFSSSSSVFSMLCSY